MQLREKLDFSFLKSTKQAILKIMLPVFAFVVLTVLCWLIWHQIRINGIFGLPLAPNALTFVFTVMMLLSILFTTYSMMKNLYFSFDNQILLTFPVPRSQVFLSKLIVYYINEFKRSLIFIVPIFIGFGIANNASAEFYLMLPLFFLLTSLIPVVFGALLSIPLLFVSLFLRRFKVIQYILAATAATAVIILLFRVAGRIPENFDFFGSFQNNIESIETFLYRFSRIFIVFDLLIWMVSGTRGILTNVGRYTIRIHDVSSSSRAAIFFIALLVCVILLVIAFFIVRPLYFMMVSRHKENNKKERKNQKKNIKLNSFLSILKKELLLRFRTPAALVQTLIGVFFLPFSIFLLNRIYGALDTRFLGDIVALTTNFLLLILILTTQHVSSASIFSSEGKAVYILKTTPDTVKANIAAKMSLNATLSMASLILTTAIIARANYLPPLMSALIFFSVFFFAISHICWSIEMDITNPQYLKIIDGVHETSNVNETKSLIIAVVMSFLIAAISTLLTLQYGIDGAHLAWITVFGLSAVFMAIRFYLLIQNVKVYFKEM